MAGGAAWRGFRLYEPPALTQSMKEDWRGAPSLDVAPHQTSCVLASVHALDAGQPTRKKVCRWWRCAQRTALLL